MLGIWLSPGQRRSPASAGSGANMERDGERDKQADAEERRQSWGEFQVYMIGVLAMLGPTTH
jgi:hypothetical protein